ncbi:MAG TPA: septal ring lytic transglycosylase RlpA family protein [Burkholderiales bacterium]|nr:septal ring lytic transglycosylase RlpA family protein [Burkholderiales bacterium]
MTPHAAAAIALVIVLSGCGTTGPRPGATIERSPDASTPPAAVATPRGGGYYLDDGPGANPPADLDRVPDAVPRSEPLQRGTLRPYTVMGRNYTPMTALAPYRARGIASWYGRRYHGKPTSSGEPYDMYGMTAAHPVLPIPSYARVTNVRNGRSVVVRINDRGPFLSDRLIDLSYTAAYKLGVLNGGSGMVEVESIMPEMYAAYATPRPAAMQPEAMPRADDNIAVTSVAIEPPAAKPAQIETVALPPSATEVPAAGGVYLQLGAFGSRDNAESYLARVKAQVEGLTERLQVLLRDGYYRVHAGPYESAAQARAASDRLMQALGMRPMVVTR